MDTMAAILPDGRAETFGDTLGNVGTEALVLMRFRPRHFEKHW